MSHEPPTVFRRSEDVDAVADVIAAAFHIIYEELAPEFGYETREASRRRWADVPKANRDLMRATVRRLLDTKIISAGSVGR